jgi:hypothetical protein
MSVPRVLILLVAISAIFLLGGRGWPEPAQAAQKSDGGNRGESEDVTLRITGDEGTRFSGVCSVGDERRDTSGQVPKSFEYELKDDRQLACEIRKQGAHDAGLKLVLKSENSRSVHRSVGGEDAIIRLTYQDGSVSSSMSSSSSQTASGVEGNNSSYSADDEPGRDEDRRSLADRIQQRVDEILERVLP